MLARPAPLLVVEGLTRVYGGPSGRPVLTGVDLTLGSGDYLAIMGESGAGKSTLLNLVAGLERPDSGTVLLAGQSLGGLSDAALAGLRCREIGFVFQAFHLLPYLNVSQNVGLPLLLGGVPRRAARGAVDAILEAVGLAGRAEAMPRELSGGELQRVAVARALVHRPRLVLADEPTGNLDARAGAQVLELLARCIREQGGCGLLVTHSRHAAATADRILVLADGRLTETVGGAC